LQEQQQILQVMMLQISDDQIIQMISIKMETAMNDPTIIYIDSDGNDDIPIELKSRCGDGITDVVEGKADPDLLLMMEFQPILMKCEFLCR
jgi:hypothetical protein